MSWTGNYNMLINQCIYATDDFIFWTERVLKD